MNTILNEVDEILHLDDLEINNHKILENINITFKLTPKDYDLMLESHNVFDEIGLYSILDQFIIVDFTELYLLEKIRLLEQYSDNINIIETNLLANFVDQQSYAGGFVLTYLIHNITSTRKRTINNIIKYTKSYINLWNLNRNYNKILENNKKMLQCYHDQPNFIGLEFYPFCDTN